MKKLELKTVTAIAPVRGGDQEVEFAYRMLIRNCLRTSPPPPRAMTAEDMYKRTRVFTALDKAEDGGPLLLEDADARTLQAVVKEFAWGYHDAAFVQFCQDVRDMPADGEAPKDKTD